MSGPVTMNRLVTDSLRHAPLLSRCGVPHGFSTRLGGVSAGPFASLNFGNPGTLPPGVERDPKATIEANFARVASDLGCSSRHIVQVHQVHGPAVLLHARSTLAAARGSTPGVTWGDVKADAIVTDDPACLIAVRIADCCPVLLSSADGRVVGAVHAGWRGVVSGVLPAAVASMRSLTREPLVAAIGPCISFDQFEVGDEVAAEFRDAFGPSADALIRPRGPQHPGKSLVDLKGALAEQLRLVGVGEVDVDLGCTVSQPDLFFSHRRDQGVTGRMIGIIGPRA